MKNYIFILHFLGFTLVALPIHAQNDSSLEIAQTEGHIPAESIQIHPQPVRVGDAMVVLDRPERILATSIYTVTGERLVRQVHYGRKKVQKQIPSDIPNGEYLLKLETESGVGLKRMTIR